MSPPNGAMRRRLLLIALTLAAMAPAGLSRAQEGGGQRKLQPYLPMDAVAVGIVRPDGRRGVLTVEVGVDVKDPGLRSRIGLYLPILNSAFVSALQPYALGLSPGQPPNADYISMTLQRETDRVLGRPGARLLLGSILTH